MPLSEKQRRTLPQLRKAFTSTEVLFGSAKPFEERTRLSTKDIPDDIAAHVEIAPPLFTPVPFLDDGALKKPERVPIFFYSLRDENPIPSAPEDTKVIFYVHGGGNLDGHPTDPRYVTLFAQMLRAIAAAVGDSVQCTIIAPCYRLATVPENTFPAAVQDVLAAYDFVIGQGYKSTNITVAGDSAGGNHVVVLTHLALHSNRPPPCGVIAIAPASKQVYGDLSGHAKAQAEADLLTLDMYQFAATAYIGSSGFAASDPLVSGTLISFTESWPRTLILIGTCDQLIDASRELEERLRALDRPVELVEYDERPHGWWLVASIFPGEIQDATDRIARFVLG